MSLRHAVCPKMPSFKGILGLWGATLTYLFPLFADAQGSTGGATIATYITTALSFFNSYVIPFIVALATLMFLFGLAKFFILSGASDEGRESGRRLALWGIITFVLILSVWGLVNVFVTGFGIGGKQALCPDYNKNCGAIGGGNSQATQNTNTQNPAGSNSIYGTYGNSPTQTGETGGFPVVDPPPSNQSGGEGGGGE